MAWVGPCGMVVRKPGMTRPVEDWAPGDGSELSGEPILVDARL